MQLLEQAGLSLADYAIQFFTFVPDPTGYITVLHKTDGSLTRCAWHNVPRELDMVLEREGPKGVRHVTVGVNGSYVVILNSGAVLWGAGVPGRLHQLLEDARRRGRSVTVSTISLSFAELELIRSSADVTPQRPSPSPSPHLAGIFSNSQTVPRSSPSPRIGTSLSIITARKPCRPVSPGWPQPTTTTRVSVPRLIHSTHRNCRKRSSEHSDPAVISLHMAAGPTLDTNHPSSLIRTLLPRLLLACRSSPCTSLMYTTTTPCHSKSSNNSNNRHRAWQSTTGCLLYLAAHSRLRAQC